MVSNFNKIHIKEISLILKLLHESGNDKDHMQRKFALFGKGFHENMEFLEELKVIKRQEEKFLVNGININTINDKNKINHFIALRLINNDGKYGSDFYKFINNFSLKDDIYSYKPKNLDRLRYSDLRNFLLELNVITQPDIEGLYQINEEYVSYIYLCSDQYSLAKFEKNLENQKIIGNKAELEIIEYEKIRLKKLKLNNRKIEHTSKINVSAGYDIKSWSLTKEKKIIPRFIEVKAVSKNAMRFYYTRNEKEKADVLCDNYFLYLLPLKEVNKFDLDSLVVIQNPNRELFYNKHWDTSTEIYKVINKRV